MLFLDRDDDQLRDECDGLGAGGAALRRGALVLRPPAALQVNDTTLQITLSLFDK